MTFVAASSNYAAVIRPLQVLVMVIVGLFFLRVLRVAVVAARPVDTAPKSARRRRGGALALEFIEPVERAGERVPVETTLTIGRSGDCELSLHDTYLSTRHARVVDDQGDLTIEDLGSTNGTYVNQELVQGRMHLERGDIVQVGGVLFEVVR
ncbi:MAG: FHA domain-containing protein [Acidobacteriota bacterium]|nr:FHA domain-containing protein [Acidobacteriota bacterium]MDE3043609.1 FHA domain-containing protein [Acidobacteriota bacterium]MDE3106961.1 FHA domain-containing protein [Acidobacteriota bacterium]MDE3222667.1 FHA domain-containing protein [Acidobacteriota bacterium]